MITKNKRTLIIIASLTLLVIIGIIIRLVTPQVLPPTPPQYPPPPIRSDLRSPLRVNLDQIPPTTLPTQANAYLITPFDFQDLTPLTSTLHFSNPPQNYNGLKVFTNSSFTLTTDPTNKQIIYTYSDVRLPRQTGDYLNTDTLLNQTIQTLKSFRIYPEDISFSLIQSNYKLLDDAYLIPSDAASSNVIQLSLAPSLNGNPIYIQLQPLITATYNRQNILIKLDLYFPFSTLTSSELTHLLTFNQFKRLPPQSFFPLFITPTSVEEAWRGPGGLASITPQDVHLAYLLDTEHQLLQPIFAVSNQQTTQSYLYAALAYPPQPTPAP